MADATLYYRTAGGALISRQVTGDAAEEPALPEGATLLTPTEYAAALDDIKAERQEHAQQLTEADEAAQLADYQALRTAGIPEATARRMSGYTGPADEG
jgi:hypothetical protein